MAIEKSRRVQEEEIKKTALRYGRRPEEIRRLMRFQNTYVWHLIAVAITKTGAGPLACFSVYSMGRSRDDIRLE